MGGWYVYISKFCSTTYNVQRTNLQKRPFFATHPGRRGERARGKREDRSEDSDASGQSNAVVEVGSNESEQTPGETAKAEEKAEGKAEEV